MPIPGHIRRKFTGYKGNNLMTARCRFNVVRYTIVWTVAPHQMRQTKIIFCCHIVIQLYPYPSRTGGRKGCMLGGFGRNWQRYAASKCSQVICNTNISADKPWRANVYVLYLPLLMSHGAMPFQSQATRAFVQQFFDTNMIMFRITGPLRGNPLGTSGLPSQKVRNEGGICMLWRHRYWFNSSGHYLQCVNVIFS